MKSTIIIIDGIQVKIEVSKHAIERCEERNLTEYEAYSMIMKLGESLLEMRNGEEFSIIDKELNSAIICSINTIDLEIVIDVITVISNDKVWISRGQKCIDSMILTLL